MHNVSDTSHLPWTKGDVVEHETWHSQMSDICTQEVPSPTAVSIHCVGRLSHGYRMILPVSNCYI